MGRNAKLKQQRRPQKQIVLTRKCISFRNGSADKFVKCFINDFSDNKEIKK